MLAWAHQRYVPCRYPTLASLLRACHEAECYVGVRGCTGLPLQVRDNPLTARGAAAPLPDNGGNLPRAAAAPSRAAAPLASLDVNTMVRVLWWRDARVMRP